MFMVDSFIPRIRFKMCKNQWEKNKLSKLAKFNPKSTLPEKFKYVDLESVLGTDLISYKEVLRESAPSRAQRLAQKGDIFFQTVRPYQKNNYLFDSGEKDYVFSTGYAQLRPLIDSAFLLARLQEESFVNKVLESCTGTSYPAIDSKDLSKISVAIPKTIEEQSAIGSLFRTLDNLLSSYKDNLANYQSLKATMLSKMFPKTGQTVPEIRLDGFEGEWEINKLNKYLTVSKKKNTQQKFGKEDVLSVSGEVGIVNQIQFQGRSFAGVSVEMYSIVDTGNIVYTKSPLKANPYGIIKTNYGIPGIVSTLYAVYLPNENVFPGFVERYFENDLRLNSYLKPLVNKGAKNDMKVSNENALLGNVIFPKLEEQVAISDYFTNLDKFIQSYKEKISQLETLKKKLLQDMLI